MSAFGLPMANTMGLRRLLSVGLAFSPIRSLSNSRGRGFDGEYRSRRMTSFRKRIDQWREQD